VPSDCYTMAAHRVLGFTAERASHVRKCPRCNEAPSKSRGYGSLSTVSGTSMSGERSSVAMLMDHIPRYPCSWYIIQLHDRIVHVLEEFMLEAGATKGRNLRLEVRCIHRSGASRHRPVDVVLLDFMAPHRHLVVDVTVTCARTNTNVPRIGTRLPLIFILAVGAQHDKLDADLRTSALLGTPSV
jgi:CheY-like chemotaxis protein